MILIALSRHGPAGMTYEGLVSSISPLITEESIRKSIESLYLKSYISIQRDVDEIRLIANKNIRTGAMYLEYLSKLFSNFIEKVKREASSGDFTVEKAKNLSEEMVALIGRATVIATENVPELTLPEVFEMVKVLYETLGTKLPKSPVQEEDPALLIPLISKYRGERDAKAVEILAKLASQRAQSQQNRQGTETEERRDNTQGSSTENPSKERQQ